MIFQEKELQAKSLMNIDAETLKKYQQAEFNSTLKGSYTMIKLHLSLEYKNDSTYEN